MKDKIIQIIQQACALKEDVTLESRLKILSLDSLSFVETIVKMEETFGIEFEIEELNIFQWEKVGDILNNVEGKINEKK